MSSRRAFLKAVGAVPFVRLLKSTPDIDRAEAKNHLPKDFDKTDKNIALGSHALINTGACPCNMRIGSFVFKPKCLLDDEGFITFKASYDEGVL